MGAISHEGKSQRVRGGIYVRHERGAQTDFRHMGIEAYLTLSGVPCEDFRDAGILEAVLGAATKATRIDIAYDYAYGSISAKQLANMLRREDVTAREMKTTETGDTYYFGSPTSNRMAVFYEFKAPHPRAGYTRFETRYYREYATSALQAYKAGGLKALTKSGFVWAGLPIPSDVEYGEAATIRTKPRSDGAKTLVWIYKQVGPAVHRLEDEGAITDLDQWLRDTFYR